MAGRHCARHFTCINSCTSSKLPCKVDISISFFIYEETEIHRTYVIYIKSQLAYMELEFKWFTRVISQSLDFIHIFLVLNSYFIRYPLSLSVYPMIYLFLISYLCSLGPSLLNNFYSLFYSSKLYLSFTGRLKLTSFLYASLNFICSICFSPSVFVALSTSCSISCTSYLLVPNWSRNSLRAKAVHMLFL